MTESSDLAALLGQEDLLHQQLRVLLLVTAVAKEPGNAGKLDGLTKLAKLDFIARYPNLAGNVARELGIDSPDVGGSPPTATPMIRYRYGPWDDQYYPVIGALVGRGLVRYAAGRKGSVGLAPTAAGIEIAARMRKEPSWAQVASHYDQVARAFGGLTGNKLKQAIYSALPELHDMPYRTELR
ncbi:MULTISPECIES: hypothetical protein [Cellulomonas]|uniref:Uncharacterized protein n=1 Tax=Cellulomonas gelida TaxID=1712 RepID=A0A4Y3KLG7_9CELL|nr:MULTISPECIES: hypothetical protein [Cellulomonas]MCR6705666.1 hypothetical protein [Cellulomonas sp.]GEA84817.1 hypothetical protein CGE01nite_20680 [Cellulomonas gelida]GGL16096.1 hypothetical protein GCM10009774_03110 [Cellulomonas gelida]